MALGQTWKGRLRASAIHFGLSALILSVVAFGVLWWLYPSPLTKASGGYQLLLLIAIVDAFMGPAITFFVFNRKKKTLKTDLVIVGLLQAAALVYGIHAAMLGRPVFQAFMVDRFEIVSASEVDDSELERSQASFKGIGFGAPVLAYWKPPVSPEERSQLSVQSMAGVLPRSLTSRYQTIGETERQMMLARAKPFERLQEFNTEVEFKKVSASLMATGLKLENVCFLPVDGRAGSVSALVHSKTGEWLGNVDLNPWQPE